MRALMYYESQYIIRDWTAFEGRQYYAFLIPRARHQCHCDKTTAIESKRYLDGEQAL